MTPEAALATLEAGDSGALVLGLELWEQHRHPALAQWIVHQDALLDHQVPDAPRNSEGFQAFWMELAQGAPDVPTIGWLARNIATRVPIDTDRHAVFGIGERYRALHARLEALERHGPDPRIAHHVLQIAVQARYSAGWDLDSARSLYEPVLRLVGRMQDASLLPTLEDLIERPNAKTNAVRTALTQLARETQQPLATAAAGQPNPPVWLDAIATWLPSRRTSDAVELLLRIQADPEDRELRPIYADALLSEGDPRGTFIALQLQGDDQSLAEADKLLRKHKADWLGPVLSRVLCKVEFTEGFLTAAALEGNASASRDEWEQAALDPRLVTLTHLDQGRSNLENYVRFLASPQLQGVRTVILPARNAFEPVLRGPNAARLEGLVLNFRPRRDELELLLERATALRTLTAKTTDNALRADHRLVTALVPPERFRVAWYGCSVAACRAAGATLAGSRPPS